MRKVKKTKSPFLKFRLMSLGLAFFLFTSFAVAYSLFNQDLTGTGNVTVLMEDSEIVVTNVEYLHSHKDTTILSNPSHSANTATFKVKLNQSVSKIHYQVTVKNNGNANARFLRIDEVSNNSNMTYSLTSSDSSLPAPLSKNIIIAPGETFTFDFVILYKTEHKYTLPTNTSLTATYTFVFEPTLRNALIPISGNIKEDSANVNDNPLGAKATLTLYNDNDFDVDVNIFTYRSFTITNEKGLETVFPVEAHGQSTYTIYIKDNELSIFTGNTSTLTIVSSISAYDAEVTSAIDTIELTLNTRGKYQILEEGFTTLQANDDFFSTTETKTGKIYETTGQDGRYTYFYRGAIKNNYFKFANYTWRILRIDEQANIRLILDGLITDGNTVVKNKFKDTYTASSLEDAQTLVKFIIDPSSKTLNSPSYGYLTDTSKNTLRGWYNNNLADFEDYIVDSNFCLDIENGTAVSSATQGSVYYFGPYQKTDRDTELYDPVFSCPEENIVQEKIGLLSIDEYVLAGGATDATNTSFFLNDSGIKNSWWTLSPSYYDPNLRTVGAFFINSDGSFLDWTSLLLTDSMGLRPVITVKGNILLTGDGTKDTPYEFAS